MNTAEVTPAVETAPSGRFRFDRESRLSYITLCIVLWSIISYLLISHFVIMSVQIKGISMVPTLHDGQHYMLMRLPYLWRSPHVGEIVVIRDPEDHDLSIKRIMAGPHDLFEIRRDGVFVNNVKVNEPYLSPEAAVATPYKRVKKELGVKEYFMLGDNREFSADSRIYGPVPASAVLGFIRPTQPAP